MSGPHVAARVEALVPSIIREMNHKRGKNSIDLSLGQPSLRPDQGLLDRAQQALSSQTPGYTLNAGLEPLRAMIAKHHNLPDRAGPEHVIVTVGSEQALFLAMTSALEPGDEALLPDPGYPAYPGIVRMLGAKPVFYPIARETGLRPSAEAIAPLITERTRLLLLNTPSNPFGQVIPRGELEAIVQLCERHRITLLSDEVYRDLVYDGDFVSPCEMSAQALMIAGLSKSCALTGLRIGYLVGETRFMKKATFAHQLMVTCAPRFAQLVAMEVFLAPEHLVAHKPFYERARAVLSEMSSELPDELPISLGQGAFYAVVDVSSIAKQGTLQLALELLEEEDVVVVPGVAFGAAGDWFLRLSYAGGEDMVREGFGRLVRFLRRRA